MKSCELDLVKMTKGFHIPLGFGLDPAVASESERIETPKSEQIRRVPRFQADIGFVRLNPGLRERGRKSTDLLERYQRESFALPKITSVEPVGAKESEMDDCFERLSIRDRVRCIVVPEVNLEIPEQQCTKRPLLSPGATIRKRNNKLQVLNLEDFATRTFSKIERVSQFSPNYRKKADDFGQIF